MDFTDKRVLVVGTGVSGVAAIRLLAAKGAKPVVLEGNEKADRRQLKRLAKGHSCKLHCTYILLPMHDRRGLTGYIDPRLAHNAELLQIVKHVIHSQPCSNLHKNRITGILHSLHKGF